MKTQSERVSPPALPFMGGRGASFPRPLTRLIARDQELAAVADLVRQPGVRLLTLTGPGGVGKTRLAIATAAEVADDFPDGVVFVDLSPVGDPTLVLTTIAGCLGLRDSGAESLHDRVLMAISERRLLLVLDNFEQVVTAAAWLVELLGACPEMKLLVTSRTRLRVTGERELPIGPLALERPPSVETTEAFGAVRLFVERARDIRPDFNLGAGTTQAVEEIVRRVDGLPLAIELAAARIKALPPLALLQRLEQRLPLLSGGARDLPLRQQTMRDTIGWSYDLLDAAEQALFRRLAVFVGGFTLEAAEAVVGGLESGVRDQGEHELLTSALQPLTPDPSVIDGIMSLIDHSLLRQVEWSEGEPRYQMLETIREFGFEQLETHGERTAVQRRHAEWFTALGEAVASDEYTSRQSYWNDLVAAEAANFRAAVDWLTEHDPDLALRLVVVLLHHYQSQHAIDLGIDAIGRVLASGRGSPSARIGAMIGAVRANHVGGRYATALAYAEEAVSLARELGDRRYLANAVLASGYGHLTLAKESESPDRENHLLTAEAAFREQLHLAEQLTDRRLIASACRGLGIAALHRGDPVSAVDYFSRALTNIDDLGPHDSVGWALRDLGLALALSGDRPRAAEVIGQSLSMFRELAPEGWDLGHVLKTVALLLYRWGHGDHAIRLYIAAETVLATYSIPYTPLFQLNEEPIATAMRAHASSSLGRVGQALSAAEAVRECLALLAGSAVAADALSTVPDPFGLTRREREALGLVAAGMSDREIAEALSISERTAGNHVQHAMQKIGVDSRTAAAVFAVRHDLV